MPESVQPYSKVQIRCGAEALRLEVENALGKADLTLRKDLTVVLDSPPGFAMKVLQSLDASTAIVVTDNPCPELWEDLWNLSPRVLLAGGHSLKELLQAVERADRGERLRKTPHYEPVLTRQERAVLRLCAQGLSNEAIAKQLGIKASAVKSYLYRVFTKLDLEHRGQTILYYWGLWDYLPNKKTFEHGDKSNHRIIPKATKN